MQRKPYKRVLWLVILGSIFFLFNQVPFKPVTKTNDYFIPAPLKSDFISPIIIDGLNPASGWDDCPWKNGSGNESSPYILKDLMINAGGTGSGIQIQNTRDYFLIQNCTVINSSSSGAGIYLYNVTLGTLFNNNITANGGDGIYMYNAHNCSIVANNVTFNADHGVELYNTDNDNFTGNRFILNKDYCFYTQYADNCTVQDNYFDRNYYHAFRWCYGQYSNFTGNAIFNQTGPGIDLYMSNFNRVIGNWGSNVSGGISVRESHDTIVTDNSFTAIGSTGISLDTSNRTLCANNTLTGGSFGISILDDSSNNSLLQNNCSNSLYAVSISNSKDTVISGSHFVKCGIRLQCTLTQIFSLSISADNDIDGKLVRVYENQSSVAIPADTGQAILVNCSGSYFEDYQTIPVIYSFYYTNNSGVRNCTVAGLDLYNTVNNTLANNSFSTAFKYSAGIRLYYSTGTNVTRNDLRGIDANYGIYTYSSMNNTLHQNNCSLISGYAIYLEASSFNNVTNNSCDGNAIPIMFHSGGLYVDGSSNNNSILWNNCSGSPYIGLRVAGMGNLVAYNNVAFSGWVGLYVGGGPNIIRDNKCWNNGLNGSSYMPAGIQFSASGGGIITNNECWDNLGNGITVGSSTGTVSNNTCWSNDLAGIRVGTNAYYCNISRNKCYSNVYPGIQVSQSSYCTIMENILYSNVASNIYVGVSSHDIYIINNTAYSSNNHGIEISVASNTTVIGNNCSNNNNEGIYINGGVNYTIANNTCTGHSGNRGIYGYNINNSTFVGNNLTNNQYGLNLDQSSKNNTIKRNFCAGNQIGIFLLGDSNNNTLIENNCTQSISYGLYINSNGNNITQNNASFNPGIGLTVVSGAFNYMSWNNCSKNGGTGILLDAGSVYNEVCYNFARNNQGSDFTDSGSGNYVHHNFFGNGPYAYFTTNTTSILEGESISFTDASFGGTPPYTYNWSFGDTSDNEIIQNPVHQYITAAIYVVNLTIEDSNHAFSNYTIEIVVSVDIYPVASFTANPMSIVSGQWVQFNDTSTPGNGPLAYQWNFGDFSANETAQNVTHQYTSPNLFTVILTVNDTDGDISVFSLQITVVADILPSASFVANKTEIRVGQWVQFNDTSSPGNGIVGYQWNFGDGSSNETTQNVTHQFNSANIFTVILTVNDTDGDISVFSLQITVTVDVVPNAAFNADHLTIFVGQSVQFNDTTTGGNRPLSYQWNFGDSPTNATTQNVTHQFNSENVFTVILTVTDTDGDISVYSLQITVAIDTTNYPPTIAWLPNLSYDFGTSGHVVAITITDSRVNNPTMTIYLDGVIFLSNQPWVSQVAFQLSIDGLSAGSHLYKIEVSDGLGESSVAYFNVMVLSDPLLPLWIILGVAIPGTLVGVLLYWRKFRHTRSNAAKVGSNQSSLQASKSALGTLSTSGSNTEPTQTWRTNWTQDGSTEPKTDPKDAPTIIPKVEPKPPSTPSPKPVPSPKSTIKPAPTSPSPPETPQEKKISPTRPNKPVVRKTAKKRKKPVKT